MKKSNYYDFRALSINKYIRAISFVLFGLVYNFQIAYAAKLSDLQKIGVNKTGNSASFGADVKAFPGVGNIKPNSEAGWYQAGNYGVAPSATGSTMSMGANGEVFFADGLGTYNGVSYPFKAGFNVSKGDIVDAAVAAANGPVGIALFAAPFLFDWFTHAGGRFNPTTGEIERTDETVCTVAPCYEYIFNGISAPWRSTAVAAAMDLMNYNNRQFPTYGYTLDKVVGTVVYYHYTLSGTVKNATASLQTRGVDPSSAKWIKSSLTDIAPYMKDSQFAPDGRVIPEILGKGADLKMPAPTVTGPSSVDGPETTTTNSDGSKTVQKTTYNFKTSGDTVTNTSNVTVTQTYNTTNNVTSTTTTTKTPVASETTDNKTDCEKNPKAVACQDFDFDTPDDEIPKDKKNITYQAENLGFGGGSCPADKVMTVHGVGQVKVVRWAEDCEKITTYVKPLVLALSGFAALMIIFAGGRPE